MMWWDGGGGWGPGGWVWMFVMMLLFWGLLAAGAVWLVRTSRRDGSAVSLSKGGPGHRPGAEALLAERFARGEIDEAEFARRRDVLRGKSPRT